jgi:tripartite-type tricarboxylate transporter receptor subunit TctC
MTRRFTVLAVVLAAGLLFGPTLAGAQDIAKPDGFPERPITLIVPYGAGGGSDQLSRAMAGAIESAVGINFQVVNKPGGGGRAAIPDFMTAPADGYTVMEHIDDAATLYASGKIKENPAEDWVPLAMAQITFSQIYIRPDDDRFVDWESFLAYAQANPGQVTIANVGNVGSMERINMLKLEEAKGFETKQISFDKPAERYAALIGGHVDALFEQPGDVRNFLDAAKMIPILTFLDIRPEAFSGRPAPLPRLLCQERRARGPAEVPGAGLRRRIPGPVVSGLQRKEIHAPDRQLSEHGRFDRAAGRRHRNL